MSDADREVLLWEEAVKVGIVGSRDYPDLEAVRRFVAALPEGTVVVSGGARGVDQTAEDAARARGLVVDVKIALWQQHGKRAGPMRNREIVEASDEIVAFWDGVSPGTRSTIDIAHGAQKKVRVFYPFQEPKAPPRLRHG